MSLYPEDVIGRSAEVCAVAVLTLRLLCAISNRMIMFLPQSIKDACTLTVPIVSVGGAWLLLRYFFKTEPYLEKNKNTEAGISLLQLILLFCGAASAGMLAAELLSQISVFGNDASLPCGAALFFYAISNVILTPCLEELLFRRVILSHLMQYGGGFAVFSSAMLFAAAHSSAILWLPAFLCGSVLAVCAIETRSLALSTILHMLYNLLQLFMLYFDIKPNIPVLIAFFLVGLIYVYRIKPLYDKTSTSMMLKRFFFTPSIIILTLYTAVAAFF